MELLKIGDEIAGIVVRRAMLADSNGFFTPEHLPLQIGVLGFSHSHVIPRHMHPLEPRQLRGTPEVIVVQTGTLTLDFYPSPTAVPIEVILEAGDLVVLYGGGHGFTANSDVRILEIKSGPYLGNDDKVRF